jgi:AcrR family transcriptional regulator
MITMGIIGGADKMARITKDPHERREEILDTAQALFGAKGYQQTSISDIVKTIGVAQGTFYYYFKSKEEVADAVIDRHIAHMLPPFEQLADNGELSGYEKMQQIIRTELFEHSDHDDLFQYLHHENNAALHQRLIVKTIRKFGPILAAVIEQGVREGQFNVANPEAVAEFFLTGFQFWMDEGIFRPTEAEYEVRVAALGGILEALLGTKPGAFDMDRLRAEH